MATPDQQRVSAAAAGLKIDQAVIDREVAAGRLTAEQQARTAGIAQQLRANESQNGTEAALSGIADRIDPAKPTEAQNENYTNSTRKADGEALMKIATKISNGEYSDSVPATALTAAQKTEVRNQVMAKVDNITHLQQIVTGLSPTEKQAFLEAVIAEPRFIKMVKDRYEALLKERVEPRDLAEKKAKAIEANKALKDKKQEIKGLIIGIADADALRAAGGLIGDDISRYPDRADRYNKAKAYVDSFAGTSVALEMDQLNVDRQNLIKLTAQINRNVANGILRGDPRNHAAETAEANLHNSIYVTPPVRMPVSPDPKFHYLESKETMQKMDLIEQKPDLIRQLNEARAKIPELVQKMNETKREAKGATDARKAAEEKYNRDLKNLYGDVAGEYVKKVIEEAEEAQKTIEANELSGVKDEAQKQAMLEIRQALEDKDTRNDIYNRLLTLGQDDAVNGIVDQLGLSTQVADQIKSNQALKDIVTTNILRAKLKSGKINEEDADIISGSEWGMKALNEALAKNQAARELLKEAGLLDEGLAGLFKGKKRSLVLSVIIALLAGTLAGPAVGAALGLSAATGTVVAAVGAGAVMKKTLS